MENISAGLKWAIGLIVTLLIVAAGISVYMLANGNFKKAQDQATSQSSLLDDSEFTMYDRTNVSGTDVLDTVKKFAARPEFTVSVDTGLSNAYYPEGFDSCYSVPAATATTDVTADATCGGTGSATIPYGTMTNQDALEYVNPTARFASAIFRDANAEVRLIRFIQVP
ncbi:hypothetical protein [Paenibacillus sp. L3-i20]|uniref:hypothetical protein n=1 Tax=Paenibacillus sp. L3-i20 TaxID=2905833 RepID=UPI001EDE0A82|nr:hypothetical protein [Paenibacillus sp. L3-i20]GKU78132.1 hypothetical protein L3i20_v225290 [Paenibacillus sp. L3-i20]